jgi:serine protease Do
MRALLIAVFIGLCAAPIASAQSRYPAGGFADLAERLTPAVVNIATSQRVEGVDDLPAAPPGSPLDRFSGDEGPGAVTSLGSGFIISPDGVVVTNNHVVDAADRIEVILQSGERFEAAVVGRDPATDIAVLRVRTRTALPYVQMGDSDTARVGDIVLAIGNPFGLGGSLSVGVVSARNRNFDAGRYDDFIQTDAAINRGNSGGPLFNTDGEVIGVNTAIVSPTGGSVGVGFATPTSIVRPVVDQLLRYGETRRGWLGVRLANVNAESARRARYDGETGAAITRVTPNGPAAAAGLQPGDIVLSFGGRVVADSRALTRMIGDAEVGSTVAIEVIRDGRRLSLSASIERLREGSTRASRGGGESGDAAGDDGPRGGRLFGIALSELDEGLRAEFQIEGDVEGLVVLGVDIDGANEGVLRAGDVIEEIGFAPIDSITSARIAAERAARAGGGVVVRINRGGESSFRRLATRG